MNHQDDGHDTPADAAVEPHSKASSKVLSTLIWVVFPLVLLVLAFIYMDQITASFFE